MARVLTNDERAILINSESFKQHIQFALRDAGDYWANHDGASLNDTLVNRIKWAKNRINGVSIVLKETYVMDIDLVTRALKACKNMQFNLGAAPLNEANLLAGITSSDYDTIASLMMDIYAEDINMTVGGN